MDGTLWGRGAHSTTWLPAREASWGRQGLEDKDLGAGSEEEQDEAGRSHHLPVEVRLEMPPPEQDRDKGQQAQASEPPCLLVPGQRRPWRRAAPVPRVSAILFHNQPGFHPS